jgi:hypothetical protein
MGTGAGSPLREHAKGVTAGAPARARLAAADRFFNPDRGEAFRMLLAGTFSGLDCVSRASLAAWLAGAGGIDTVLDLSQRPWNVADAAAIIGVFERGNASASWLIVRHRSLWTLVRCGDAAVCETCATLGDILRLIDDALRG